MFRSRLPLVTLVAAVGFQLRSVVLAVPPVLPAIRDDLHLTFTAAGALTALPVLCLGAAAVPGAVLVNRFGARLVVGAGTAGLGVTALLRLAPPEPVALFAFSGLMALCIALAQPAMTAIVRAWFPGAVQRAGTVFATALGLGGLGGAVLTIRLASAVGWRGSFVVWSLLALAVGLVWLALAPGRAGDRQPQPSGLGALLRDGAVWHVAALFGGQSLVFYAASSWIPFELRGTSAAYLSLVLLLLNAVNVPVMSLLVALPWPWASSRRFYALAGALMTAGAAALAVSSTSLAWLWVVVLGVGTAMTFAGTITLPALFARSGQAAGYSAVVLTAGYAISFAGPFLGGVLLDRTHSVRSPFWLMTAVAAGVVVLGLSLPRRGREAQAELRSPAAGSADRAG
ncbi:MAG TPA: MFS transporter [Terriglobales bacterium]|nr:MFS transporter [Terriglobales bacterium]